MRYVHARQLMLVTVQLLCIVCLSLLLSGRPATAQSGTDSVDAVSSDPAAIKSGRAKAQGCTRCHGRDGIQRLAQDSDWSGSIGLYVMKRLTELRDGVTHHSIMTDIARNLSDEDIGQISAWMQSLSKK